MRKTRLKVCGMRDPDQVKKLVDLGVDAIGMIFYEPSPRNISLEDAKRIRHVVPPFVSLVGVFVNTEATEINRIAKLIGLDLVQLHGDQDADFAQQLDAPYIRAIRVKNPETIEHERQIHSGSQGFLFDTFSKKAYGGTGHRIESSLLPSKLPDNTILAGGINPDNIIDVLECKPSAVDINSGVEFSPGNKNIDAIESVITIIRNFDIECSQ